MSDKTASSIKAEKAARQALELKQELAELKLHGLVVVAEEHVALGDEITFLNVRLQYLFVALFDRCRFSGNDKAGIPVHQPYRTL